MVLYAAKADVPAAAQVVVELEVRACLGRETASKKIPEPEEMEPLGRETAPKKIPESEEMEPARKEERPETEEKQPAREEGPEPEPEEGPDLLLEAHRVSHTRDKGLLCRPSMQLAEPGSLGEVRESKDEAKE